MNGGRVNIKRCRCGLAYAGCGCGFALMNVNVYKNDILILNVTRIGRRACTQYVMGRNG